MRLTSNERLPGLVPAQANSIADQGGIPGRLFSSIQRLDETDPCVKPRSDVNNSVDTFRIAVSMVRESSQMVCNPAIRMGIITGREEDPDYAVKRVGARMRFLVLLTFGFILVANCGMAFAASKADGLHQDNQWLKEHLLGDAAQPPFSFAYDRQGSSALLKAWPKKTETRQLDDIRTEHSVTWSDPKTRLRVRLEALEFANSPVVEWTAYFKNEGNTDAPILEYVQALDVSFPVAGEGIPTILYSKGCGVMDTYSLQNKTLNQLESFQL
jgi:hypothetical protein